MLVPYAALSQLPPETLNNLIKEYVFSQLEDGSFSDLNETELSHAIAQCQQALKAGQLVVEYSEDDHSIGIRHKDNITNTHTKN